jgi:hypothetical protein
VFKSFISEQRSSLLKLKCKPGEHLLLCDLTKFDLNSQGSRDAKRIAISASSALLKLQMQRLLTRTNARIFDDVKSGEEWLISSSGIGISK